MNIVVGDIVEFIGCTLDRSCISCQVVHDKTKRIQMGKVTSISRHLGSRDNHIHLNIVHLSSGTKCAVDFAQAVKVNLVKRERVGRMTS